MKLTIGVMGSSGGHLSAETTDKAHRLGAAIAEQDAILIMSGQRRTPGHWWMRARWFGAATLGALIPAAAWAQERAGEWGWGMHPMAWMWGAWGLGMMLMMLVFWGLVIAGIVLGIRWLARRGDGRRPDSALEILRQRYARGEINREEFEAKKRDLT
jgi:putative membrane protein